MGSMVGSTWLDNMESIIKIIEIRGDIKAQLTPVIQTIIISYLNQEFFICHREDNKLSAMNDKDNKLWVQHGRIIQSRWW